ncbi:TPA: thioesterase [Burkholderia vietnamiensis]|uniref:thioesterase II family protein n=1 Tax=Burkholderia vietnamiensis TaxID=60552 RepID=UPI001BA1298D|nr:thioesterase [Burkholderia vietnamiensis]HDR9275998.1 thioesterase [Burkholderia vietnamiensis]
MSGQCAFVPIHRVDAPRARVYCFHHAGGNAASFSSWAGRLAAGIDIWAAQLPNRFAAALQPRTTVHAVMPAMVAAFDALRAGDGGAVPFAFYGHSLGALFAYELARTLSAVRETGPTILAVSGHRAPNRPLRRAALYDLDDESLVAQLRALGGIADGLLDDTRLWRFILPMLRADLYMSEAYSPTATVPLAIPLLGFRGESDPLLVLGEFDDWAMHTSAGCRLYTLPGGHFFDDAATRRLQDLLSDALLRAVEAPA